MLQVIWLELRPAVAGICESFSHYDQPSPPEDGDSWNCIIHLEISETDGILLTSHLATAVAEKSQVLAVVT